MKKIEIYTFENEADENKLIRIKNVCKEIFSDSGIEYKLDIESKVEGGVELRSKFTRYSTSIIYYVYLCVDDDKEQEARIILNKWFENRNNKKQKC